MGQTPRAALILGSVCFSHAWRPFGQRTPNTDPRSYLRELSRRFQRTFSLSCCASAIRSPLPAFSVADM